MGDGTASIVDAAKPASEVRPRPGSSAYLRRRLGRAVLLLVLLAAAGPATQPVDHPPAAADAEGAYVAAVKQLRQAEADVVRARQLAVADYRSAPPYAAAAKALSAAFDAYAERRNGLVMAVEQHDPRYATWKRQAADADAEIDRAGQTPATTPEQFDALLAQRAEFVKQLQASEDDAVNRDADARRLRQQWTEASDRLTELQSKQAAAVESTAAVKGAEAAAIAARTSVDHARAGIPSADASDASASPEEFTRRYPRHTLLWADAGLDVDGHGPAK